MSKYPLVTDTDKYALAQHIADVYAENVFFKTVYSQSNSVSPTEFAKKYIDCFQQIYDLLTKNC